MTMTQLVFNKKSQVIHNMTKKWHLKYFS